MFGTFEKLRLEFHQTFSRRPRILNGPGVGVRSVCVGWHGAAFGPAGQFLPYAIILGIFYFLILLPMKQAAEEGPGVSESLKVGDKVITTSGIYGQITRVSEKIRPGADRRQASASRSRAPRSAATRVRIPSSPKATTCSHHEEHSLESLHRHRRVRRLFPARRLSDPRQSLRPAGARRGSRPRQLKLGLDLRGGVHLVLRVHTDEALRTSTTTTGEQLRERPRAPPA